MFVVKKFSQQRRAPSWAPANHNPIYRGADLLRKSGLQSDDLRVALLALTVTHSAFFGYPMTMVISDDSGRAEAALNQAIQMVPPDRILQLQHISPELIYHRDEPLKRRCILTRNSKSLSKMACHLDPLLGDGRTVMQHPYRDKYGSSIQKLQAMGPVSCMLLMGNIVECPLHHPFILKIRARTGQDNRALIPYRGDASCDRDLIDVDLATVRFILGFALPQRVDVPFAHDLSNRLTPHDSHTDLKLDEVILRMVRTFAILNNLKAPSNIDMQARLLNVDADKLAKRQFQGSDSLVNKLVTSGGADYTRQGDLTATKIDYYVFWVLANGLIDLGDGQLTDIQLRVYEAVRKINLQRVEITFSDTSNNSEALISISHSPIAWVKREAILREVNAQGQEEISMSTLMRELGQLADAGHIEKHRQEGDRHGYYHVMTMSVGRPLELPHPSKIVDPIYMGNTLEVVNPLTGALEHI